jgi:D-alanyl-D-alanine carboxypeptidase
MSALPLLLLLLTQAPSAQPCTRWAGGVTIGDDYTAAVLHLPADGHAQNGGSAAFPNQHKAVRFSSILRQGDEVQLQTASGEAWVGRIDPERFEGTWTGDEAGRFALRCVPEIPADALREFDGTYRYDDDGTIVRIAFLKRITDAVLLYFDPSKNDERWLFPQSPTSFTSGPTFEKPFPVERRFKFEPAGLRVVSAEGLRTARRLRRQVDIPSEMVEAFLRERDVPGATVGIVGPDGLLAVQAFGVADRERRIAATPQTIYQIGSVTKVFTATLLVKLVENGTLRLDDRVGKWLPSDAVPDDAMTLRHLVTHTAGLPHDPVNRVDQDGVMQPYSRQDLLTGLRATVLQSPPGTRWSYSNLGFALLGYLMERATGQTYEALVRRYISAPLAMHATAIAPIDESGLAIHYWPEDNPRRQRPRWRFGEVAAFGGLTSTVPDLSLFVALHLRTLEDERPPLSGLAIARMQTPQTVFGAWDRGMGIGWMMLRQPDGTVAVHHGGEVDGHSSFIKLSPANRVGVIVLSNLGGATAGDLGDRVFASVLEQTRRQNVMTRAEAFAAFFRGEWADAAAGLEKIARGTADEVVRSRYETARERAGRRD